MGLSVAPQNHARRTPALLVSTLPVPRSGLLGHAFQIEPSTGPRNFIYFHPRLGPRPCTWSFRGPRTLLFLSRELSLSPLDLLNRRLQLLELRLVFAYILFLLVLSPDLFPGSPGLSLVSRHPGQDSRGLFPSMLFPFISLSY